MGWQQDIRTLLASWDLLVMPSLDEAFPLSALEAMAAARPVIASRVGGLLEIVVDGVTGYLISAKDTEALVRHIAALAKDRTRLAELGQAGWERARSEFSDRSNVTPDGSSLPAAMQTAAAELSYKLDPLSTAR